MTAAKHTFGSRTLTVAQWVREPDVWVLGITQAVLKARLEPSASVPWDTYRAITTPCWTDDEEKAHRYAIVAGTVAPKTAAERRARKKWTKMTDRAAFRHCDREAYQIELASKYRVDATQAQRHAAEREREITALYAQIGKLQEELSSVRTDRDRLRDTLASVRRHERAIAPHLATLRALDGWMDDSPNHPLRTATDRRLRLLHEALFELFKDKGPLL